MAEHNDIGIRGELIAFTHLEKEGYTILEKNWRFKRDEVDIIATKNDCVVFVEVKTRSNDYAGEPIGSVSIGQQKRIIKVAGEYLRDKDDYGDIRFDIIGIISNSKGDQIEHVEEAFYPTL